MSQEEAFVAAYEAGEVVFFAGAGASFDSGAAMPPAVLAASADLFFPDGPAWRPLRDRVLSGRALAGSPFAGIQPEVFYEHLLGLCEDREALGLWRVLSERWLATQGAALSPNANHFALAHYGARTGLPVFTTNFDTLIEAAADRLGLEVSVGLAGEALDEAPPGGLRLYKLHGTVERDGRERLDTLHTTMESISAVNPSLIAAIEQAAQGRALTFLGYSGCDIDYFPVLAATPRARAPFWFAPPWDRVTRDHASRIGARRISRLPSDLFAALHPGWPARCPGPDANALLQTLKTRMGPRLSEPQKILMLGQCLQSVGRNSEAAGVLDVLEACAGQLGARDRIAALLLRARVEDCLSAYERSEQSAGRALAILRASPELDRTDAAAFEVRARYQRGMARQLQIGPALAYGHRRLDWRPPLPDMLGALLTAIGLSLRFAVDARRLPRPGANGRSARTVRAEQAVNDHLVMLTGRLVSFLEGFRILRVPGIRGVLRSLVGALYARAHAAGDYFAYAGAQKYLARLEGAQGLSGPSETYGLLREPLNAALVWRDAAVRRLESGDREAARVLFRRSREAAFACGSRATELKALAGIAACDDLTEADARRLEVIAPAIEGRGFRRYWATRLQPFLSER